MMGKTHAAVGALAGTAFAVAIGSSSVEACQFALVGALGGIAPDVDSEGSIANQLRGPYAKIICSGLFLSVILWTKGQSTIMAENLVVAGCAITLAVFLWLGSRCSHRGFTHSVLACIIFAALLVPLFGTKMAVVGGVGWLSHLAIDLLNLKGEQIAFPLKKRVCFRLCKASGIVDRSLLAVTSAAALLIFVFGMIT